MAERSDSELTAILASHGSGDWQPEVYPIVESILRSRGVEIEKAVAEARADQERSKDHDTDELVVVSTYLTPAEAHLCRTRLEQGGIEAFISDEQISAIHFGFAVAVGGIKVSVRSTDVAAASAILEMEPAPADAECPKCGSSEVVHTVRTDRPSTVSANLLLGVSPPQNEHASKCSQCGAEW